ncbi:UDP-glucose 4-epimerase [Pochonia chlamydosporia 170]|uniref:UDP-glucose 4-epimerase n=1 Tax=Pochonia chlamydosporia 170 TaxID=1380566 RepID=A0A179EYT1_METCM|nr:UDP-glucose 4-epimerase [Pochonia chlamydosporia 170]OAQ58357.1 UDP-glucose 4-epimerase [Pochonia chlamydosporia 170]
MAYFSSQTTSEEPSPASSPPTTPGDGSENGDAPHLSLNEDTYQPLTLSTSSSSIILVIGGLGYIGSHTSLELLKAGYNVVIVDSLSNSFETAFARIKALASKHYDGTNGTMPALCFHKLDYRSRAMRHLLEMYSIPTLQPPTTTGESPRLVRQSRIAGVIHFAAFKSVSESIAKPIQYYQNNVCGLVDFVELLGQHNIRNLVFSSSATVYGSQADLGRPLREEDVVHHPESYVDDAGSQCVAEPLVSGLRSPYARTKYFCEAILADIAYSDPAWRIVCLRYFNPIGCDPSGLLGEDPKGIPTNLFPVISQVLTGVRKELDIFGTDWETRDGTPVRDFIHVSDVARGHVAAIGAKVDAPFRTFNLGSGSGTTVREAIRSLEATSGKPIPVNCGSRRPGDVGFCVASNERAFLELGWSTKESISQCARDLWNFVSRSESNPAKSIFGSVDTTAG